MAMKKIIKKQMNWITTLVLSVFLLFVLFFEILLVFIMGVDISNNESPTGLDWITLVALSLLLVMILDVIIWQIIGYEVIQMEDAQLIYQKRGKLFSCTRRIPYYEIDSIQVKSYPTTIYNLRFKLLGTRGGKIKIEYLGRDLFFGLGLTEEKAQEYVLQMNKILMKDKTNYAE